jgi:hypothetical protein
MGWRLTLFSIHSADSKPWRLKVNTPFSDKRQEIKKTFSPFRIDSEDGEEGVSVAVFEGVGAMRVRSQ